MSISHATSARTKAVGDTVEHVDRADLKNEKVKVLTNREPLTLTPDTPLATGLERMQQRQGECILVCDGRQLLGIVTERDILLKVLGRDVDMQQPLERFMTAGPDTLSGDATVREALEMMETGGYRNLPLVDAEGNLTGLLRQQDVIEFVAEAFPQEILNLPPRPHQLIEEPEGA